MKSEFENLKTKKGGNPKQDGSLAQQSISPPPALFFAGLDGAFSGQACEVAMANSSVSVEELGASLVREYLARKVGVVYSSWYMA